MGLRTRLASAASAFALAVSLITISATPANADTLFEPIWNGVTGDYEGNYKWIDCGRCGEDGNLVLGNVRNGYAVRARVYAKIGGTWYKYRDISQTDGRADRKYTTGYPPKGAIVRVQFCFLENDTYRQVGVCQTSHTINNYY